MRWFWLFILLYCGCEGMGHMVSHAPHDMAGYLRDLDRLGR